MIGFWSQHETCLQTHTSPAADVPNLLRTNKKIERKTTFSRAHFHVSQRISNSFSLLTAVINGKCYDLIEFPWFFLNWTSPPSGLGLKWGNDEQNSQVLSAQLLRSSMKIMNENEARYTTSADIILQSGALWPPSTSLFKWNGINASRDLKQ